jgi:Calcineurin-like phosphoesterase/FG-GAP-like repeat
VKAANPHGACYSSDNTRVFWFLHVSDLHIGMSGTNDSTRLQWLVTTARSVINPQFIVATGDLTDSTNGNFLGIPNGPHQEEWDQYKSILAAANAGPDFFYDLPGNHDAYSDQYFAYYLANSVQGQATGKPQVSWTRQFPFGKYHFLGVNTAGNDGAAFSLTRPWGDNAGLDAAELAFIDQELQANDGASLTLVFGHHPVTDTGVSDDTWLFYGQQEFIHALDVHSASTYHYGHTHRYSQALFKGNSYTGVMTGDGIHYDNVASLGKSSGSYYTLVAIDCNGVSSVTPSSNAWPVVLITAPVDRNIGGAVNPYAYDVSNASANPIRALVFDSGTISQVSYRIDSSATWSPMTRVAANPALWEAVWDASPLAAGDHTIEVRAIGTTTVSDSITVNVSAAAIRPPAADFTGDLKSDLLWRHATQGDMWLWTMNGGTVAGQDYVASVDPAYTILATGDFTGDGKTDVLWRHATQGDMWLWTMNGSAVVSQSYVGTVDPAYVVVATGDFDGDRKADLLWRHSTAGDMWMWLMNGPARYSEFYAGTVDVAYEVKGAGDLDNDGKTDLLWQGIAGDVWAWLMNGAAQKGAGYLGTVADSAYQIEAVADFDGDRKADLLWRGAAAGDLWLWPMDGLTKRPASYVATVDPGYAIIGVGDYDGDTKSDLLWQGPAGDLWIWMMDGAATKASGYAGTVPDLEYKVVKAG